MITVAEINKSIAEVNLPTEFFTDFKQAKDFFQSTTQQSKELLSATTDTVVNTITTATNKAVDTISAAAKGSLEQTLQKVERLNNATSNAMQTAINNSVGDWLEAHPVIFRLVQFLIWGTNHPIWGLVILLFIIAIAWSLIKAISSLIETAWLALLKTPFKLSQALFGVSAKSLNKFGGLVNKQLTANKNPDLLLQPSEVIQLNKQQRLAEISTRLETIQKEQSELLQEITAIVASDRSE